jgi:ABC-type multidrug transport system ATPase subunit
LVIDRGRLIEERKIGELKDELRQYVMVVQSTKPIAVRSPQEAGSTSSGGNIASSLEVIGDGMWRANFESKAALLEALHQTLSSGMKVVDIVAQEGSLEDYFIETVRRAA